MQCAFRPAIHSTRVGQGSIFDNAVQPGGEARAALKLFQIPKREEKSLLHSVLGILWIAEDPHRCPTQPRQARRKQLVQFHGTHIHRQSFLPLPLRDCASTVLQAQVAP